MVQFLARQCSPEQADELPHRGQRLLEVATVPAPHHDGAAGPDAGHDASGGQGGQGGEAHGGEGGGAGVGGHDARAQPDPLGAGGHGPQGGESLGAGHLAN